MVTGILTITIVNRSMVTGKNIEKSATHDTFFKLFVKDQQNISIKFVVPVSRK